MSGIESKTIIIGIQARCTSSRLPNKVLKKVGKYSIIHNVLSAAHSSCGYINAHSDKSGLRASIVVLTPFKDPLITTLATARNIDIICGDEEHVLSRYLLLRDAYKPDYIVRITADCPLVPPYLITKFIYIACKGGYDYISNADAEFRTAMDGVDVEVISKKAWAWLEKQELTPNERQHVTLKLRTARPVAELKMGAVVHHFDLSNIKLSVDTEEDLQDVRNMFARTNEKLKLAKETYGDRNVHRV